MRLTRPLWPELAVYLCALHLAATFDRYKRTVIGLYPVCPRGCSSCSPVNGCVTCERTFFLLLLRHGIRHQGYCTFACPHGYYGNRRKGFGRCLPCRIDNCEMCFNRHYCTRCVNPYLPYRGKCVLKCPSGFYYANYSRDCKAKVDCMVGPWSEWGPCKRNGRPCTSRFGTRHRKRTVFESPSVNGIQCPELSEKKHCRMPRVCLEVKKSGSSKVTVRKKKKRRMSFHRRKKLRRRKARRRRRRWRKWWKRRRRMRKLRRSQKYQIMKKMSNNQ